MEILAIIAEAMSLIEPGIKVTESLAAIFTRGKELAAAPTQTPEDLAAFKRQIADEKARLAANTAEIEKD